MFDIMLQIGTLFHQQSQLEFGSILGFVILGWTGLLMILHLHNLG